MTVLSVGKCISGVRGRSSEVNLVGKHIHEVVTFVKNPYPSWSDVSLSIKCIGYLLNPPTPYIYTLFEIISQTSHTLRNEQVPPRWLFDEIMSDIVKYNPLSDDIRTYYYNLNSSALLAYFRKLNIKNKVNQPYL